MCSGGRRDDATLGRACLLAHSVLRGDEEECVPLVELRNDCCACFEP